MVVTLDSDPRDRSSYERSKQTTSGNTYPSQCSEVGQERSHFHCGIVSFLAQGTWGRRRRHVQAALRELAANQGGEWRAVEEQIDPKRQDSRRFLFERLDSQFNRAIGKVRPAGKNAREIRFLHALREFGLRPPSAYTVPQVLAYVADDDCLITEFAPGTLATDIIRSRRNAIVAMRRSAEWLTVLHGSAVPAEEVESNAADVLRWCRELIEAVPQESPRISHICDTVGNRVANSAADMVPAHGDYHPEHVFVDHARVTAIDFDRFGLRPRADDIGLWLARTATIVFREHGTFSASESLRQSFLAGYGLPIKQADIGAWIALYFLKSLWFGVANRRRPHLERVDPLLWAASQCLSGDLSLASR